MEIGIEKVLSETPTNGGLCRVTQHLTQDGVNTIIVKYTEYYNNRELLHSKQGPACITEINGAVTEERYLKEGDLHNTNGPAYITYYDNGNIKNEQHWINGKLHNTNGPADISYYKNGSTEEEWYIDNGEIYRKDGAAFILYNKDGSVRSEAYFIKGREINGEIITKWYNTNGLKFGDYLSDNMMVKRKIQIGI